ncbi:hypothetical protein [Thalassospira sp.]|uniref:DUF6969 family protein n=1 Tax=Thalassospira sp. TaxID=1912094 RepID=UPI002737444A|nr:hypothetical protein [Thalassospira sp.]MDP2696747.1 hypothetical protein [Thalassospira sp.]
MTEITVDWAQIETGLLQKMQAAGRDVMECQRVLAATGDNIVGELIRDADPFFEWSHYPDGDVYDRINHGQFYYHAHPKDAQREWDEHGHFHTFMRPRGMPDGITPLAIDGVVLPDGPNDALSHLVAISMDGFGLAQRLFTTNRWVTGEIWYDADSVVAMLDNFIIDHAKPSWPVNRWVSGMMVFYRPQIEQLIRARDLAVAAWQAKYPDRDVYEDRDLEVTSTIDIRVEDQMRAVNTELARRR